LEFENNYGAVGIENFNDTDFGGILSREFKRLVSTPYCSRNATKRYQEGAIERFQDTKAYKKL